MSDPTRGITCPDTRRVVREALDAGWEWAGFSGGTHGKIRWTTGVELTFGTTPGGESWKPLARNIQRHSGVVVWRRGNRKRSRKSVGPSGFSIETARRENTDFHRAVFRLQHRRTRLITEARQLANARKLSDLAAVLDDIQTVETELRDDYYQPVQPFDPTILGGHP